MKQNAKIRGEKPLIWVRTKACSSELAVDQSLACVLSSLIDWETDFSLHVSGSGPRTGPLLLV